MSDTTPAAGDPPQGSERRPSKRSVASSAEPSPRGDPPSAMERAPSRRSVRSTSAVSDTSSVTTTSGSRKRPPVGDGAREARASRQQSEPDTHPNEEVPEPAYEEPESVMNDDAPSSRFSDVSESNVSEDTMREDAEPNAAPREYKYQDSTTLSPRSRSESASSKMSRAESTASSMYSSHVDGEEVEDAADFNVMDTIEEDFDYDDEEDEEELAQYSLENTPINDHINQALAFVVDHEQKLQEIEENINMNVLWDRWSDPISLHMQPPEKVDVQDLIKTDNELFNKVLTVLAVLCDEIGELKVTAEENFYPAMIMFGQAKHGDEEDFKPGDEELMMGRMLPFFQDISNFVDRCNSITINLIHQLASLYHSYQKLWKSTFRLVHLIPVFSSLCDLLEVMITLDSIVEDNVNIGNAWEKYKRMMQYVRAEPERYGFDENRVRQFERLLVSLDQTVMSAAVLQGCIEQDFEVSPIDDLGEQQALVDVRNNQVFLEECSWAVQNLFGQCEASIGTLAETFERQKLVGVFGLYTLYRRLVPPNVIPDASFYQELWSIQKKVPMITLAGKVVWYPSDFLLKYVPFATKKLDPDDVPLFRREYLKTFDQSFPHQVHKCYCDTTVWLARMDSFLQPHTHGAGDIARLLQSRSRLIATGQILAARVSNLILTLMNMHLSLAIPMQKKLIRPLCQCIEMLKAIEFMYGRKVHVIAESLALMIGQVGQQLLALFRPIKTKLEASRRFDDTKLDVIAAVTLIEDILKSGESMSFTRQIIMRLASRIAVIGDEELTVDQVEVMRLLGRMRALSDWQRRVKQLCDCSFIYWSRELFTNFIQDIYSRPEQARRIQYVIAGFSDVVGLLDSAQHESDPDVFAEAYEKFLNDILEKELVNPLCHDVENDLRLHVHCVNVGEMDMLNPKVNNSRVLGRWLDLPSIRIFGKRLNLKQRVTHHLETVFYNLTTVALHDWKTYAQMRNLANEKYDLSLAENHLPMGSLDQGLDILQIMRNVHIFVSRYNYNLNQQTFLERRSDKGSKHLNSINIHSIAASIRTHGMGIMNTTVNYTYQFLAKKFDIFSQFLFDEYIKSYLLRQRRWYKKHRNNPEVDNKYPYAHAFEFNKGIRRLGVSDNGRTFLDQFRILITEIGNSLGYVRMVRSAGMNYCSNAIKFVPELNKEKFSFVVRAGEGREQKFDEEGKEVESEEVGAKLPEESVNAAKNLDSVIASLSKNFSENVDYFKLLVKVFQDVMMNTENKHLANFYMIVPALTINFVEATVQAKDQMFKNSRRREAYFSDDGFAIGVAYILAILNQGELLDSLHWFESVSAKYDADAKELERLNAARDLRLNTQKPATSVTEIIDEEQEVHTLQLNARRIEQSRKEFDLLYFSLSGARIFFNE